MNLRHTIYVLCMPLLLCLLTAGYTAAQEYVYVNTDNLIVRDRPEEQYMVYAILDAPSKLKVEPYEADYNSKAIRDKYYHVSFSYTSDLGFHHYTEGWVMKKYMASSPAAVTWRGADTTDELVLTDIPLISYVGSDDYDPNDWNYPEYPYPKYKGGETHFKGTTNHTYRKGPRGGCYYVNGKGRKVYVDNTFCGHR